MGQVKTETLVALAPFEETPEDARPEVVIALLNRVLKGHPTGEIRSVVSYEETVVSNPDGWDSRVYLLKATVGVRVAESESSPP